MTDTYPDLHGAYGWPCGVHKSPQGYQHPWLLVMKTCTAGLYSRFEARQAWKGYRGAQEQRNTATRSH